MKEMGHRSLARLEGVFFGFFFILDCGFNLLIVLCDPLVVVLRVEGNGGVVGFVLRGVEVLIGRRRLIVFICILRAGLQEDDLSLKGILGEGRRQDVLGIAFFRWGCEDCEGDVLCHKLALKLEAHRLELLPEPLEDIGGLRGNREFTERSLWGDNDCEHH
jgi:hypothetical protein